MTAHPPTDDLDEILEDRCKFHVSKSPFGLQSLRNSNGHREATARLLKWREEAVVAGRIDERLKTRKEIGSSGDNIKFGSPEYGECSLRISLHRKNDTRIAALKKQRGEQGDEN